MWGHSACPATEIHRSVAERLGAVVMQMSASRVYQAYTVADIERLILPCLVFEQAWVAHRAFGTWAWLTEEAEAGFVSRTRQLQQTDLVGGDRLWVIDFAAPFGDAMTHIRVFKQHLVTRYGTGTAKWTRLNGDRTVRRIGEFSNEIH